MAAESVLIGLGKTQQCERCFFVTAVCDDLYGTYIYTHTLHHSDECQNKQTNKDSTMMIVQFLKSVKSTGFLTYIKGRLQT